MSTNQEINIFFSTLTASIVALVIIGWLVILEFTYFLDTGYTFKFSPDTDLDEKLTINVDITVAMPCSSM
jgi:hypothetical protein